MKKPRTKILPALLAAMMILLAPPAEPKAREEAPRGHPTSEQQTVADIDDPWLRSGAVAQWTGDLDGMLERGFIRLLTTASRTHYFVDGARERGIMAAYATALEEEINRGRPLADTVRVVVLPVQPDELLPMLIEGYGDIAAANLAITPARQRIVDFAAASISDVRELVVTGPGVDPVTAREELAGREIWVTPSSNHYESLIEASAALTAVGLDPIDVRAADRSLMEEDLLEMVNAGLYPATVADSHMLDWIWSRVFDRIVVSDVAVREGGQIAPAIRKDSPLLHALLGEFRLTHGRGTLFGNVLINRYYSQSWWLRDATSTAERRKFDAVVDLFRKYSAEYDFDYLMMIALGYQESRLEPDARSHVGAIGIMQVMPATAAGPPIFMDNVESPDDNIRAGIMYMRHLVDRFFNDPAIDEVNRHLIAFAAYNAGPTRVARLRRRAPEYGLDPDLWFRNVERIVASNVGREPVRYVGNIYKYYLAFRRLREIERGRAQ